MAGDSVYDLVILGGGPGGYVAAVRAGQLGLKTACVDREERLGGVCLRVGCIPSKALLDSSEFYHLARERLEAHGVRVGEVELDLGAMMARKDKVVEELTANVRKLVEGNGATVVRGVGRLDGPDTVRVTTPDGEERTLEAKRVLLAAGSEPVEVSSVPTDGERIVTSTEALAFERVPERLVVMGGGYIGLEMGSIWARLGSEVTVVEALPRIAAATDGQVARTLLRLLKGQGLNFRLKTRVLGAEATDRGVTVTVQEEGKDEEELPCDRLLVAVGRRPLTRGLGLEDLGVELDSSGFVKVDPAYRTTASGVYAIGDLVPGPALAHKASAEAIAAVEGMAGMTSEVNYDAIPAIIYTAPEVASVGLTEDQVKERGIPYCSGTYPFAGSGRARCMGETDGFVKVLAHKKTDRVLGVHIIGPRAADMIAECVLALEMGASAEDLARTVHGHPTFGEAVMEAARSIGECSVYGR